MHLLPLFLLASLPLLGQAMYFRSLTGDEGLSQLTGQALFQDQTGFVWVGTQAGVNRWDGRRFETFGVNAGLGSDWISAMAEDSKGNFWVGHRSGLARLVDGHFEEEPALRDRSVLALLPLPDGRLVVGCQTGLLVGTRDAWQEPAAPAVFRLGVQCLALASDGELWLGTLSGLYHWDLAEDFRAVPAFEGERIVAISLARDSQMVATRRALFHLVEGSWRLLLEPEQDAYGSITSMVVDSFSEIWVGTPAGLLRLRGSEVLQYDESNGLSFSQVRSLMVDAHGLVWVGGVGGVAISLGRAFELFDEQHGLPSANVRPVVRDGQGLLWVGTSRGLAFMRDTHFQAAPFDLALKSQGRVFQLRLDREGRLWASGTAGIFLIEGTIPKPLPAYAKCGGEVRSIAFDGQNRLWCSIFGMGVFLLQDGVFQPVEIPGQAFENSQLLCDSLGQMWVGGRHGLSVMRGTEWRTYGTDQGLRHGDVYFLAESPQGAIWLNYSSSFGASYFRDGSFQSWTKDDGLSNDSVYSIGFDRRGNAWLGTSRGVDRIEPSGRIVQLSKGDGYPSHESNAAGFYEDDDGSLWFGTAEGLAHYRALYDPSSSQAPPPTLLQAHSGSLALLPEETPVLAADEELQIQLSCLHFVNPRQVEYQYCLLPRRPDWEEFDGDLRLSLSAVGRQELQLRARVFRGSWSPTITRTFDVPPPLWQRASFLASVIFLALAAMFLAFRFRTLRIRHHADRLALEVFQRTADLQEKRVELESTLAELQRAKDESVAVLENFSGPIWSVDCHLDLQLFNSGFRMLMNQKGLPLNQGESILSFHQDDPASWEKLYRRCLNGIRFSQVLDQESSFGTLYHEYFFNPIFGPDGRVLGASVLCVDITQRKQAEKERELLHRDLHESARRAGMADVATSVLHNVGNVLNSLNVSSDLLLEKVSNSPVLRLGSFVELLKRQEGRLAQFLTEDPKGRLVPKALEALQEKLCSERESMIAELKLLATNLDHIKSVIVMQQNYAKSGGFKEPTHLVEVMEQAVQINAPSMENYRIELFRSYEDLPAVLTDKTAVLQILVNLIGNAKNALQDQVGGKTLRLGIVLDKARKNVLLSVSDNGVGICEETMHSLFTQGFTRMKGGHGFGLHSGAISATNLGGRLVAASDGLGKGATFTLSIPFMLVDENVKVSRN
jgi:ligand-binding sensor domain-containing protein/C4-dicarboxylate-specific signal transduction histidine kinase